MGNDKYTLPEQAHFLNTYVAFLESGYSEQLIIEFLCVSKIIKKNHIGKVEALLLAGEHLSMVLEYLRFHEEIQAYISHGEQVGDIISAMHLSLLWIKDNLDIRKALKQALTYPLVLVVMSVVSFIFVACFLFPQMESFLSGYQINEKPFIFIILELLMASIGVVFALAIVFFISLLLIRLLPGKLQLQFYLRIPGIRYYLQHLLQIQIANRLSLYLGNGYSCLTAFRHISNRRKNGLMQTQVQELDMFLSGGSTLEEAFARSGYYSEDFLLVLSFAVKNDTLGKECSLYSKRSSEVIIARVVKNLKFLQTILTCIIALFLVLTYIAVFLPMLSVFDTL